MPDLEARPSSLRAGRPALLSIAIDDDDDQRTPVFHSRGLSGGSAISSEDSPDSAAALILIHDDDDDDDDRDFERPLALDFSTDDDGDSDDLDDSLSPLYQVNGKLSIPPLTPFTIFVYLLSPYLKLGALLLPFYQLPLKYGLSGILVSALLAVVARHLLYLLARYLRKADLEEVVGHTFVSSKRKGRKGERRREFFRFLVRLGTAALRILLVAVYLQECVHFVLPLLTTTPMSHQSSTELAIASTAVILALLLAYPGSLASWLVIIATNLSVFTYVLWLAAITYLYTQGTLPINPERTRSKNIWDGFVTTVFIFTSSNTLPLYASIKGTIQSLLFNANTFLSLPESGTTPATGNAGVPRRDGSLKQPLYRSFKLLSLLSVATALALILPLVGFAAYPNENPTEPATASVSANVSAGNILIGYSDQLPYWELPFPPGESTPATRIQTYITPVLASLTLLFGTPQLLITIPTFPAGSLKWLPTGLGYTSMPRVISRLTVILKKSAVGLFLILLTLIPLFFGTSTTLRSWTTILSILATYYVPPVLHILTHTFKSPLSIILPSTYFSFSSAPTPVSSHRPSTSLPVPGSSTDLDVRSSSSINGSGHSSTSTTARAPQPMTLSSSSRHRQTPSQQLHDVLLQRKERALQKRQMRRRIIWDIWAWVIFLGGFVVLGWATRVLGND
ncbi:hypothetical protein P691DRAFT_457328 [Macrolepiota fuliginosa MF-IS2]|uniref:Uncharacterized protein n=1 Tax=Macrolepiota fuliginosa MF-IS2 TaxID=1400762 RepID=A0A9P5XJY1_9AGAR|nr:hypothetical protein P691DRAFT_457328 [Macrolepiota fuliginosa MF-IS2]